MNTGRGTHISRARAYVANTRRSMGSFFGLDEVNGEKWWSRELAVRRHSLDSPVGSYIPYASC